jgi:hypothetical protein
MFTSIFLFLPFVVIALLPLMKSFLSSDELNDMGLYEDQPDYAACNMTPLCGHA